MQIDEPQERPLHPPEDPFEEIHVHLLTKVRNTEVHNFLMSNRKNVACVEKNS